jgi:dihydropteroate synthase
MGFKDTFFSENHSINCQGRLLDLSRPVVMGILNVTPDSFFDGGNYTSAPAIGKRVKQMIREEWERIRPALEIIRGVDKEIPVSVDTFRTEIAAKAVKEFRAGIINDITGGNGDPEMFDFIAESRIPYVLMHMLGTPETMQHSPEYHDVVDEVLIFLQQKISELRNKGAIDIVADPGFGFGKTMDHNYQLLGSLDVFAALEVPLLVGISRKSMVYNFLGAGPGESLNATSSLHMFAMMKGARILRVHDVKEAVEGVRLFDKLRA